MQMPVAVSLKWHFTATNFKIGIRGVTAAALCEMLRVARAQVGLSQKYFNGVYQTYMQHSNVAKWRLICSGGPRISFWGYKFSEPVIAYDISRKNVSICDTISGNLGAYKPLYTPLDTPPVGYAPGVQLCKQGRSQQCLIGGVLCYFVDCKSQIPLR